jgi:hypothetical protein
MPPAPALQTFATTEPVTPMPVQRVKFDRWLWERDIDNVVAAEMFDSHPMSIGRWRKRYDDPDRRVPPAEKVLEIERRTGGEVQLLDWFRPSVVAYVDPDQAVVDVTTPPAEDLAASDFAEPRS